ncbi:MAG TPA: AAA family ATPase [Mycobacteriales bacterium]|jgi:transitional endoplasmic reticulum ATPase
MPRQSEVAAYRRYTTVLLDRPVAHPAEREAQVAAVPRLRRRKERERLERGWAEEDARAAVEARVLLDRIGGAADDLRSALADLAGVDRPELLGKVDAEALRLDRVKGHVSEARDAVAAHDFGAAGAAAEVALRELGAFGGTLVVSVNGLLARAAVSRAQRAELEANDAERRAVREGGETASARVESAVEAAAVTAESLRIAARILCAQVTAPKVARRTKDKWALEVQQPQELETFAEVGGLEDVKERLRAGIGAILERPDAAARYGVEHNGILFHGPPGTGKTLLSRAIAGEYGMRYIRFSPATIASSYVHEAAANVRRMFETAANNVPCVLFLDEIDTIAGDRGDQPSADHREVVTQLMNSLEEFRKVPGLVIAAATNDVDRLDPGLREGRFDLKVLVGLPDTPAREDIARVLLERRGDAVDWDSVDVTVIAGRTRGRNAAMIETVVSAAAQRALAEDRLITQDDLVAALKDREAMDRLSLDDPLTWDDVVLAPAVREQLDELLTVFAEPELAKSLGVTAPAGMILHGPPGTGKTTVAKVVASQVNASFYEATAADLLSKWVGESEQKVAKLFAKARANKPSVIFVDEIEGLLRRRSTDSASPWEQRVVGQFLRELDGLRGGEGVLLIGATNRIDIVDEAIVGRRLTPIEVGMPDLDARERLLTLLCRDMALGADVDLRGLAGATDGMSGADLKRLRDAAGRKALTRAAKSAKRGAVAVTMADFGAVLGAADEPMPAPRRAARGARK